ncbi:helix-turn-helix domain-containing protein [Aquipuribacter hungaricus]|uniref:Helix-turn-helix domain-containing protein n=1 Tax=Aquipuribacter hungaricus TaxID=545624 RepID=A0ABV7WKH8_9MICO
MVLLREEIGDVLRGARQRQGRTLRDVSSTARVSLGYLSEVERGQKEASSELLLSICEALDVPMSSVLRSVSDRVAVSESLAARLDETAPAARDRVQPRAVDGIRKTVIRAPQRADDDLAPVA